MKSLGDHCRKFLLEIYVPLSLAQKDIDCYVSSLAPGKGVRSQAR